MVAQADVDVLQLWQEYRSNPTVELRNRMVERYLPLVKYNAERIWARLPDGVELDDLISAGVFGLMDAIDAFDLNRGVKFETYCVPRIRGAMLDELRTMDWVPRLVRSKRSKMEEARKELEARTGPAASSRRTGRRSSACRSKNSTIMFGEATAVSLVSLNKKWYETDSYKDVREIDILEDKKAEDPTHRLQNRDLMRLVTRGLEPQRAPHHHPLLLRGHDDEGDRRHARSERIARQPDAFQHRIAIAKPASQAPARIQQLSGCSISEIINAGAWPRRFFRFEFSQILLRR